MMAVGMLTATSCSDFDDYNSEVVDPNLNGNMTLWENMSDASSNVKEFAQLAKKAGFADVLNSTRYFTVWAPLDGTYNSSELMAMDSTKLLKEFVLNHIADRNYPASGTMEEKVITLNKKAYIFNGIQFGDAALDKANMPSKNGTIHALKGKVPFLFNVYEYLNEIDGCKNFIDYVKKYEITYLDEHASIKGPIVEGVQTWIDSVMVTRNTMFEETLRADVENEDSSYTIFIPTDEAWNMAYNKIDSAYNYLSTFKWQDLESTEVGTNTASSTKMTATLGATEYKLDADFFSDSIVKRKITDYVLYSNNEPYNEFMKPEVGATIGDTILTTRKAKLTNVPAILDATVGEKQRLSNGWARKMDALNFLPWETYNPTIKTLTVGRGLAIKDIINVRFDGDAKMLDTLGVKLDNPEEEFRWLEAAPSTLSGKPELDFYLNDARSTTYNIYVVLVQNLEKAKEERLPYALRFDLSYTNSAGNPQKMTWGDTKTPVMTDPTKIADTISLGEFTFPICYYGLNAAPNLKISHTVTSFTSTNRNKYEQTLRVANIILKPVEQEKYEARKEN